MEHDVAVFNGKSGSTDALHVYRRSLGVWSYESSILDPQPAISEGFGSSVAVTAGYLAAGAPWADDLDRGAVYVFRRSGSTWEIDGTLSIPSLPANSGFGDIVAFSGDRLLVGRNGPDPKEVCVFARGSSAWTIETSLTAAQLPPLSDFGTNVAATASAAAVSAPSSGAVYVFERQGTAWQSPQQLTPSDVQPPWGFGSSLALNGTVLVVGMPIADDEAGAAYVFERDANGWVERQKLLETNPGPYHWFGSAVGVSSSRIVVGAPTFPQFHPQWGTCVLPCIPGTIYIYERGASAWEERSVLRPTASAENDFFGGAITSSRVTLFTGTSAALYAFTLLSEVGEPCATAEECATGLCEAGVCSPSSPELDSGMDAPSEAFPDAPGEAGAEADAADDSEVEGRADAPDGGGAVDGAGEGMARPPPVTDGDGCACRFGVSEHGQGGAVGILLAGLGLRRGRRLPRAPAPQPRAPSPRGPTTC
ncbi:MAG: hypothetical protein IT376_03000 [Polyangiaceae bacterium]|nr:hypothetical protein [Polyangiaceae bacterium]